jgi:hypothetical protein
MSSDQTDLSSANAVPWQPSQRYPDPAIQILDQSFDRYRIKQASVERIAHGFRWCEGPVWFGDGRYLLWSDIPNNRILKWVGRANWRGQRVQATLRFCQRQHARPPRSTRYL